MHRKAIFSDDDAGQIPKVTPSTEAAISSLSGGGRPLSNSERSFFEPRFCADFSGVRIHSGSQAGELAQALQAKAFSVGRDVCFGKGQYAPGTSEGRNLLAHELTHVLQQNANPASRQVQRACGRAAIGPTPSDCVLVSKIPRGERFLFNVNCDEFAPGEQARLLTFAGLMSPTANISILGMASSDGRRDFNESLSCKRAERAEFVLTVLGGVPSSRITSVEATGPVGTPNDATMRAVDIDLNEPLPPKPSGRRTVTINVTVLRGATDNSATDVSTSNSIYSRAGCDLRVSAGNRQTLNASQTSTILGADNLLDEPSGAVVSSEERTLITFNRSPGQLTAYYVPGFSPSKRGTSLQTPRHGVPDSLIMGNSAASDTFTHELGHILERDPSHNSDPDNLMADGSSRNVGVDNINTTQCNAFRNTTTYPV